MPHSQIAASLKRSSRHPGRPAAVEPVRAADAIGRGTPQSVVVLEEKLNMGGA